MTGIIGKKIGMTSFFTEEGVNIPCTLVQTETCTVTQVKTKETDGYEAVQLAAGEKREKSTSNALKGHFKKANTAPKVMLKEFSGFEKDYKSGDEIKVLDIFEEGDFVDVTGISKGKGFQGVVKRHGFSGVGGRTHGQHNRERAPGSIGAASYPSRVFKGMRMGGRTGNDRVKVQNLEIVKILEDKGLIFLKGAVPGGKGSYLMIEK